MMQLEKQAQTPDADYPDVGGIVGGKGSTRGIFSLPRRCLFFLVTEEAGREWCSVSPQHP